MSKIKGCRGCRFFVPREKMTLDVMATRETNADWYNIFPSDPRPRPDGLVDNSKSNGCSASAFFIPDGYEDRMLACGGKGWERVENDKG
jgi:hypothetical protein